MGYLCELHCPSCGYQQTFKLGSGRKDYNQKKIYSHFDVMEVWSIKVTALEKHSRFLTFHYRLGRCRDCGCLQEVPEVLFEDSSAFHSRRCNCNPKIEHEIQWISDDIDTKIKCPECDREIYIKRTGLWD